MTYDPSVSSVIMSNPAKYVRLSAAQAKQIMFDALDNDSYSSDSVSGNDYDDDVKPSEQSDEESVNTRCPSADSAFTAPVDVSGKDTSQIEVEIRLEVGSRGRGTGLAQSTSPVVEIGPTDSSLYEKNCVET